MSKSRLEVPSSKERGNPLVKRSFVLSTKQDQLLLEACERTGLTISNFLRKLIDKHVAEYLGRSASEKMAEPELEVNLPDTLRANLQEVSQQTGLDAAAIVQLLLLRYLAAFLRESRGQLDDQKKALEPD